MWRQAAVVPTSRIMVIILQLLYQLAQITYPTNAKTATVTFTILFVTLHSIHVSNGNNNNNNNGDSDKIAGGNGGGESTGIHNIDGGVADYVAEQGSSDIITKAVNALSDVSFADSGGAGTLTAHLRGSNSGGGGANEQGRGEPAAPLMDSVSSPLSAGNNNPRNNRQNDKLPSQLSSRIIHTRNGAISGVIVQLDARHLDPVESYRGIPYASPPVGNLRFMPPVSAAMWPGVKKADRFGPVCPQNLPDIANETAALERMPKGRLEYLKRLLPYLQNQSEDCLYLNIYVPIQVASRDASSASGNSNGSSHNDRSSSLGGQLKYPVMVFVHGESYEWNSGNPYDGSVLASYGQILVVTINYRLGLLGFLNANTDRYAKLPANYGLMDIIAALHWLKENIAAFGGDPTSITLAGQGTGAACVHFLISSMAVPEGLLFNRAILMSGSGLTPWSLVKNPAKYAAVVAHHLNCASNLPHVHLMKCLREKTLEQLLSVPIRPPEFGFAFGPSIDGVVIDGGDYAPPTNAAQGYQEDNINMPTAEGVPLAQLENLVLMRKTAINKLSRYDLMAGVTRAEAFLTFNSGDVQYGFEADRRSKILKAFVRNTYTYHLNEIFATIVNEYTDWERPVQHPINIRDETLEALSDAQVVAPAAKTVDLHSADHRNSYLYVFDYQTRYGDYPQRQGCIHGEDLPYIFGAPLVGGFNHFTRNYTKSEINLSEIVMMYWANFVRSGNPNEQMEIDHGSRQERSRYKTIEWTAYESNHKKYLNFDTKPKLKNHYRAHRLSFWLNLIPDLHKPGGENIPAVHHQLKIDDDDVDNSISDMATIKPLNPSYSSSQAGNTLLSNFTLFTNQVFSLLNYSAPALQRNSTHYSSGGMKSYADDNLDANDAHGGAMTSSDNDGFAAYSTALSVTIAIGCSLLILNVLIFAGVYYQRDKIRLSEARTQTKLKRQENGQMPNNICGDLESLALHAKSDPATILSHHHAMQHHQMTPPEFVDIPHRVPPPPKHVSVSNSGGGGGGGGGAVNVGVIGLSPSGTSVGGASSSSAAMGLLPMMTGQCGTLSKKSCMKQTQQSHVHQQQQQHQQQHVLHQQQQQQQQHHLQQQAAQSHIHQSHQTKQSTFVGGSGGGLIMCSTPSPLPPVSTVSSTQQHSILRQSQQQQQQQQQHQKSQLSQQHIGMDELCV